MLEFQNFSIMEKKSGITKYIIKECNLELKCGEFVRISGNSNRINIILDCINKQTNFTDCLGQIILYNENIKNYDVKLLKKIRLYNQFFSKDESNIYCNYSLCQNIRLVSNLICSEDEIEFSNIVIRKLGLLKVMNIPIRKLDPIHIQLCSIAISIIMKVDFMYLDISYLNSTIMKNNLYVDFDEILENIKYLTKTMLVIVDDRNVDVNIEFDKHVYISNEGSVNVTTFNNIEEVKSNIQTDYNCKVSNVFLIKDMIYRLWTKKIVSSCIINIGLVIMFLLLFLFSSNISRTENVSEYNPGGYSIYKHDTSLFTDNDIDSIMDFTCEDGTECIDYVHFAVPMFKSVNEFVDYDNNYYKILPVGSLQNKILLKGKMPNSYNEVIVSNSLGFNVGDQINISNALLPLLSNQSSSNDYLITQMEIVGIYENNGNKRVYVTDEYISINKMYIDEMYTTSIDSILIEFNTYDELNKQIFFSYRKDILGDKSIDRNTISIGQNLYDKLLVDLDCESIYINYDFCNLEDNSFSPMNIEYDQKTTVMISLTDTNIFLGTEVSKPFFSKVIINKNPDDDNLYINDGLFADIGTWGEDQLYVMYTNSLYSSEISEYLLSNYGVTSGVKNTYFDDLTDIYNDEYDTGFLLVFFSIFIIIILLISIVLIYLITGSKDRNIYRQNYRIQENRIFYIFNKYNFPKIKYFFFQFLEKLVLITIGFVVSLIICYLYLLPEVYFKNFTSFNLIFFIVTAITGFSISLFLTYLSTRRFI